jgi:hypothetical protein
MQRIDAAVNQPLMAEFRLMHWEKRDPLMRWLLIKNRVLSDSWLFVLRARTRGVCPRHFGERRTLTRLKATSFEAR